MKMPVEQKTLDQFFTLLRHALWRTEPEVALFNANEPYWEAVRKVAFSQSLGMLVGQSLLELPSHVLPPKTWVLKMIAYIETHRAGHEQMNEALAHFIPLFNKEGIKATLLKGQHYALFYPNPTLRQCGDIDLYIGKKDYYRAIEIARREGCVAENHEKVLVDRKHYWCQWGNIEIELHHQVAALTGFVSAKRFTRWGSRTLDTYTESIPIGRQIVSCPPAVFNQVYCFAHLLNHFLHGGIGLRQLCDWVLLLNFYAGEDMTQSLKGPLTQFKLLDSWKRFTPLAVTYLGLPPEKCPFYSPQYKKQADNILALILEEGNFGQFAQLPPRPKSYYASKFYSVKKNFGRLFRLFCVVPGATLRFSYGYLYNGIRQVIKERRALRAAQNKHRPTAPQPQTPQPQDPQPQDPQPKDPQPTE